MIPDFQRETCCSSTGIMFEYKHIYQHYDMHAQPLHVFSIFSLITWIFQVYYKGQMISLSKWWVTNQNMDTNMRVSVLNDMPMLHICSKTFGYLICEWWMCSMSNFTALLLWYYFFTRLISEFCHPVKYFIHYISAVPDNPVFRSWFRRSHTYMHHT